MKKAIFLSLLLPAIHGYSQTGKIVNAINYYNDYTKSKDVKSLQKAKEVIDAVPASTDSKDQAKIENTKGKIYLALFESSLKSEIDKQTAGDDAAKQAAAYGAVNTSDLDIAYKAFNETKKLDAKNVYALDVMNGMNNLAVYYSNKGAFDYNAKKYAEAVTSFEKAQELDETKDTSLIFNTALAAEASNNYGKAIENYKKLTERKVGQGRTYAALTNAQLANKDTTAAMATLKEGRAAYPSDLNLLLSETDYYIRSKKSEEALKNLNQAIEAKPADPVLFFARGNMYDNLANPKDANGKELDKKPADYIEKCKMAEKDYSKAIELKPDYFDALFNLGVLYYNQGVIITKKADGIKDKAKYDAENKRANEEFKKAMGVMEKAEKVNPTDKNTLFALKQIYVRLDSKDKLKAVEAKLK